MKKILTNYRYYILAVLFITAVVSFIAMPNDCLSVSAWIFWLVLSKITAVVATTLSVLLYRWWERRGMIPELVNYFNRN